MIFRNSNKLRVAVLMGGPSHEHTVSLKTGRNVMRALRDKYAVQGVLIGRGGEWPFLYKDLKQKADLAFIAMHGTYGEDGEIQSILEEIKMPYTGSGILPSALAINKFLSLRRLLEGGLHVPRSILVSQMDWRKRESYLTQNIHENLHYPLVVKPNALGSSVGVEILHTPYNLAPAIANGFSHARDLIIQSYIPGREFTCGVLDHGVEGSAYPLLPTEIIAREGRFFDYEEKYSTNGAIEVTPPNISDGWIKAIRSAAVKTHRVLGCRGMSRTDMILGSDGNLHVLEVNTIPGLTNTSLLPKGAASLGISFSDMLERIIQSAFAARHS